MYRCSTHNIIIFLRYTGIITNANIIIAVVIIIIGKDWIL